MASTNHRASKPWSHGRRPLTLRPAVLVPLDEASARLAVEALQDLYAAHRTQLVDAPVEDLTSPAPVGSIDGDTEREDTP